MKVGTSQGQGKYHIQAEINMIPLIDVALVLLIIFMVISPILVESQMLVELPQVTNATTVEETALKVEIAFDGTLAYKGKIISKKDLNFELRRDLPPGHNASLLIQADKQSAFDDVVYVMDLAKQYQVKKLGVSVIPNMGRK